MREDNEGGRAGRDGCSGVCRFRRPSRGRCAERPAPVAPPRAPRSVLPSSVRGGTAGPPAGPPASSRPQAWLAPSPRFARAEAHAAKDLARAGAAGARSTLEQKRRADSSGGQRCREPLAFPRRRRRRDPTRWPLLPPRHSTKSPRALPPSRLAPCGGEGGAESTRAACDHVDRVRNFPSSVFFWGLTCSPRSLLNSSNKRSCSLVRSWGTTT